MSDPFTAVGTGDSYDPYSVTIANEIVRGYSERRQALYGTGAAVDDRVADEDGHYFAFWSGMQSWIETNCVNYVDHTQAVGGNFDGQASIPMFSLASFRAAAGLNASGFRRATDWTPDPDTPDWEVDPDYSYGFVQEHDIAGPWVKADFIKALSTLRWSALTNQTGGAAEYKNVGVSGKSSCASALADQITLWNATGWTGIGLARYRVWASLYFFAAPPFDWRCAGERQRHRAAVTIPNFRPCAIGTYYFPCVLVLCSDIDGYGIAHNRYLFWEEWPEIAGPPIPTARGGATEATWIGNTTNPVQDTSLACPAGSSGMGNLGRSWFTCVVKWNFTNSD